MAKVSTKDIAAQSSLDKPTISRTTERLVARKLITSATDPGDRRKVSLKLTKTGQDKYVRLLHALSSWDSVLLECLSAKQVAALDEIVRLIEARIDKVDEALEARTTNGSAVGKRRPRKEARLEGRI